MFFNVTRKQTACQTSHYVDRKALPRSTVLVFPSHIILFYVKTKYCHRKKLC